MRKYLQLLLLAGFTLTMGASLVHAEGGVAARQANQRRRIAQGVRSGQLTRLEARGLARNAARIRRGIARDRRDGRTWTRVERARAHRRLNQQSRAIHRLRHNGRAHR
jgi:hypothetical protein